MVAFHLHKYVLFVLSPFFIAWPAWAVSTYTCTTFVEDGEGSFPGVYPTGINNQGHIAGSFESTSNPFGTVPFFVDASGADLPFIVPPFAAPDTYAINSINNLGQIAGTALDNTISPPLYRGFISNPDGTVTVVYPPANTPDRQYRDIFVFSINDRGETSGVISTTDTNNVTASYLFIRDSAGFFTLFDPSDRASRSIEIDPLFQPKLNNSRAVLLGFPFVNVLRFPDGSEATLTYRIASRFNENGSDNTPAILYGINNTGLIVGDAFAPFVMDSNGNAPAVVCPEYRDSLNLAKAYAVNDNGVVIGNIQFSGTVFVATPTGFQSGLKLSNASWGFSPSPVGVQGGSGIIYVNSTGAADLTFVSISIGAPDTSDSPNDFTITGNTCMPQQYLASTLPSGGFCTISFTFKPTANGARTAQIQIEDDAPDGPHIIRLDGTGLGKGTLQFSNDYWRFNQQPIGTTSGEGVVYVYNPGTDAINFSSIAISAAGSSDFAISMNSCGPAIAPYTTCAVAFQFTPQAAGARSAALVFSDDSGTGRQVIPLAGNGY